MPITSLSIQQQLQAVQSGVWKYPRIAQVAKDAILSDEFQREDITPTNAFTLYTSASNDGNATISLVNGLLRLITDNSASGDDATTRSSGLAFSRVGRAVQLDARSQLEVDIIFQPKTTTNTEGFIGLLRSGSALTALPTTARHLGLFWNRGTANDLLLTSGNNSAQATTSTGEAITDQAYRLNIIWNGDNSATLNLFDESTINNELFDNLIATQDVTSLADGAASTLEMELHFFVQTESTAAITLDVHEWRCKVT